MGYIATFNSHLPRNMSSVQQLPWTLSLMSPDMPPIPADSEVKVDMRSILSFMHAAGTECLSNEQPPCSFGGEDFASWYLAYCYAGKKFHNVNDSLLNPRTKRFVSVGELPQMVEQLLLSDFTTQSILEYGELPDTQGIIDNLQKWIDLHAAGVRKACVFAQTALTTEAEEIKFLLEGYRGSWFLEIIKVSVEGNIWATHQYIKKNQILDGAQVDDTQTKRLKTN